MRQLSPERIYPPKRILPARNNHERKTNARQNGGRLYLTQSVVAESQSRNDQIAIAHGFG